MESLDYANRFQEALRKAFAARSPDARAAYFDLACFYRGKLPGIAHLYTLPNLPARRGPPKGKGNEA